MNIFLLLLIILVIILWYYLYYVHYNYTIQDDNIKTIENEEPIESQIIQNENLIQNENQNPIQNENIIVKYLESNCVSNSNNEIVNVNEEKNFSKANLVDILMTESNLNIEIPEKENPNCVKEMNGYDKKSNTITNFIDKYLSINSSRETENFE